MGFVVVAVFSEDEPTGFAGGLSLATRVLGEDGAKGFEAVWGCGLGFGHRGTAPAPKSRGNRMCGLA